MSGSYINHLVMNKYADDTVCFLTAGLQSGL